MSDLTDKNFKAAIINMFKDLRKLLLERKWEV